MNTAGFWQDRSISLPQKDNAMNRITINMPRSGFLTADLSFEYENEYGIKTQLSYELAGKRTEDHLF